MRSGVAWAPVWNQPVCRVEVDAAIQDERAVNLISTQVGPWLRCTRTTGQKLFAALPRECADFILLDAPCSGDTLARREGRGLAKHLRGQPDAASMKEIVATCVEINQ